MKKIFLALALAVSLGVSVRAAEVALVYDNEAAVTAGKFTLGTVVSDGILISAQMALAAGQNLLAAAPGQSLHKTLLVRLDNDLNLAVIRLGDAVENDDLDAAFRKTSQAVVGFVPPAPVVEGDKPVALPPLIAPKGQGWIIKINDKIAGTDTIEMKKQMRKSQFKVEIVCLSTGTIWSFNFRLTSNPRLGFWKPGRTMSLNEVPKSEYEYSHQQLFTPLKNGKSVEIPIEAHYIKDNQEYDWTIEITTKSKPDNIKQTVRVKFI